MSRGRSATALFILLHTVRGAYGGIVFYGDQDEWLTRGKEEASGERLNIEKGKQKEKRRKKEVKLGKRKASDGELVNGCLSGRK